MLHCSSNIRTKLRGFRQSVYICVNHKTELIDFNRRILNHKLLTVTEQNGTATLSKTQRVHNESKFQHGGSLVQSSTFFFVSAHVPHAHRRLIRLRSKLLVTRFHILGAGARSNSFASSECYDLWNLQFSSCKVFLRIRQCDFQGIQEMY